MDRYNNPSDNNNSYNPWESHDDNLDTTQEIPVIDDTNTTTTNDDAESNYNIPEYTPSSYNTAPETEHKSHIGRNFVIGAVAVAAVAGAAAMFSGNQTNAAGPITSSGTEISAPSHEINEPTTSTNPDTEKIQAYKDTQAYADGLTIQEFANSCGFDNLSDVYDYCGKDTSNHLQYEIGKMGYHVSNSGIKATYDGILCATSLAEFELIDNTDKFGQMQVLAEIENNNFNIQLSVFPFDIETDKIIEYDADTIPTPEEAAQILADNS